MLTAARADTLLSPELGLERPGRSDPTGRMKRATLFCLLVVLPSTPAWAAAAAWRVDDYGAIADGKAKTTASIQRTIDACAAGGGGEVAFGPGTYLTGSIVLKSGVTLHVPGGTTIQGSPDISDYPLGTARWEGMEKPAYQALIHARQAAHLGIIGEGTIQGDPGLGRLRDPRAPALIETIECQNLRVEGLLLRSTRIWTLHPTYCDDVVVRAVRFETEGPNSDGIDIDSCRRVTVDRCTFATGDDNIAIKSGKGQEGVRVARPSQDITITRCTFTKGYVAIALGSELSGGIERVRVSRCVFGKSRAAFQFKSRPGRAGYVRDVVIEDIDVGPAPLLEITNNYAYNPDAQGVPGVAGLTEFRNITIRNARVQATKLVTVEGTVENPVRDLTIEQVTGTCTEAWQLKNARGVILRDIHLTGLPPPQFMLENVQGSGFGDVPAGEPDNPLARL